MVWGGVSQHHQTELVVIAGNLNTVRYREDILLSHVVPFLQAHPDMRMPPAILLVLCMISCKTEMPVFSVLPWPAKSLYLNPIEHVWDLLDQRVRARDQWKQNSPITSKVHHHIYSRYGVLFSLFVLISTSNPPLVCRAKGLPKSSIFISYNKCKRLEFSKQHWYLDWNQCYDQITEK
jgi:hypothetical protein